MLSVTPLRREAIPNKGRRSMASWAEHLELATVSRILKQTKVPVSFGLLHTCSNILSTRRSTFPEQKWSLQLPRMDIPSRRHRSSSAIILTSVLAVSLMSSPSFTKAMSSSSSVPDRMKIPDRMHDVHSWLPSSKLIPLDLQPAIGDLVVEKNMILKGDEVVQRHTGTQGSIVFIVRRPG